MAESIGLGDKFNVVGWADSAIIYMKHAEVATFASFLSAGNHSVTLEELIDGASAQNLAAIDTIYKSPGNMSGTWTKVTQTAASTYAVTDAVNDLIVIQIRADQLSAGYNCIRFTNTSSYATVYLSGLRRPADPDRLDNPIAA